ncbi:MAG: ABC transporter ATP-binding protein [Candidatus Omnitrophica bacterium 4484_213]|nr:MAG: ABC transporter ATP-binding protein [Candidatus Omnitrophica bacterium 4484_213]
MIKIRNLRKSFGEHLILDSLNLDVRRGETMVIIGRSGCGKSVLLKHIVGILKPDRGEIFVNGENIVNLDRKRLGELRMKIGVLFQEGALFDSLTVGENVGFLLLEHSKKSRREIFEKYVREKLAMVGLSGVEDLRPAELSGGMKKRVGLARAICANPELILYDEPTTGVDPIMAAVINDLIRKLHNQLKVTSVAVTHDIKSAYKIADRIAMLYQGKIIEVGTPREIKNSSNPVIQQFIKGEKEGPIER